MTRVPEQNIPTIFVVLGATGDLVSRKIAPALFHLFAKDRLPDRFAAIGVARRSFTDAAFRDLLLPSLAPHGFSEKQPAFLERFSYHQGDFADPAMYTSLAETMRTIDDAWGVCANKLFYLAVPPDHYEEIFKHLAASGLADSCGGIGGWTRVLVEKPFGSDAATAERLDLLLGKYFKEEQIYRLDHYLAKEMLQNIVSFRFANGLFEGQWNSQNIASIEIRLHETLGVEKRGAFYDGIGALRDVGQNHLLQMLALLTMDRPNGFDVASIRQSRRELLEAFALPDAASLARSTRAQYSGYQDITGVRPDSETETFFRIHGTLCSPRWSGTEFSLESGKRMQARRKEIVINFRHPERCLVPSDADASCHNRIVMSLEPEESIRIHFWSKKPGLDFAVEERSFTFSLREQNASGQYIEEYEKLLLDCIRGDQTLFVSTDEVRAMWRFIDPILAGWRTQAVSLERYAPDTNEAVRLADAKETSAAASEKPAIGLVGLGKMGANLARRLTKKGYRVHGFNRTYDVTEALASEGIHPEKSLRELVLALPSPRTVWLMIPAGAPIHEVLFAEDGLASMLSPGDTVIDGGNGFYKDADVRGKKLAERGIHFLDVGVSGGPGGALNGPSLMIGGTESVFRMHERLFLDLARPEGFRFFEGYGAGHFVKMVHNGIEYGMMQALAEGFAVLGASPYQLPLADVANLYNRGSVIESRLVGWLEQAFSKFGTSLEGVSGTVAHTGEGEWTVKAAQEFGIPVPVIQDSFNFRVASKEQPSYTGKLLSGLRNSFGGHSVTHTN